MPTVAMGLKPLGDGFIKSVKMLIGPIVFCTVTSGITNLGDLKKVGRVGAKALLYFEVLTTVSLGLGLMVVHWVRPGAGMSIDPSQIDANAVASYAADASKMGGLTEFLLGIIPSSPIDAFARGDILQILFFAILFGVALIHLGERGRGIAAGIESFSAVFFRMFQVIMRIAPLGALGAMAFTVGKYGVKSLIPLAHLMGAFYLTCLLFVGGILGAICRLIGIRISALIGYLREELLLVLGTSSSESALPGLMAKLEAAGCEKSIVGLVVPAGYSFNLDGTSIYLTMAAVFVAQALQIQLTWTQELTLLGVLLISSKGAAGVTGSGFITLAATLATVPSIPVGGLALILGIDRFMSEARALTNLIGNAVATLVVARWENSIDEPRLHAALAGRKPIVENP